MKAIFFYILFMCAQMLYAEDTLQVSFFEVPALGSHLIDGVGTHIQNNNYALNIFAGILEPDPLSPFMYHVKTEYLFYPKKGLFLGSGLGMLREPKALKHAQGCSGTFEASLGYEWQIQSKTKFSIEANAMVPFQKSEVTARIWPNLSFGIEF